MRDKTRFAEEHRTDREQFGVEHGIPLPWPQDHPPDKKLLRSHMTNEMRPDEEYRTDRAKFGVEYGIPPLAAGPPP